MRIIHTSDWHIGRRFERESMEAEQLAFLEWLAAQVSERRIDLVVVAGDVYDRSLPAEDAVAVLDAGLNALRAAGATVAMISGNHDSPRRLGFGSQRQALGGVHIFADDQLPPTPWLFETGDERIAVVAVPFLDPQVTPAPLADESGNQRRRTHENVLVDALASVKDRLRSFGSTPTMAVAHAFVTGAQVSDSEKQLAIGGVDAVEADVFAGFDYTALGHLHRPQLIGGMHQVAYSGSPLPYSFSEDHPKSVRLIELKAGGIESIEEIAIPVGRPVSTLTGTLEELLGAPAYARHHDCWVAARLTDEVAQVQPMDRLRKRFGHIVSVRYASRLGAPILGPGALGQPIEMRAPEDLIFDFLANLRNRPASNGEQVLVREAVAASTGSADS